MNKHIVILYIVITFLLSVVGGMMFGVYTEIQNDKKFLCAEDNSAHFLYRTESNKTPWAELDENTKNKWREFAKTRMKELCR